MPCRTIAELLRRVRTLSRRKPRCYARAIGEMIHEINMCRDPRTFHVFGGFLKFITSRLIETERGLRERPPNEYGSLFDRWCLVSIWIQNELFDLTREFNNPGIV